MTTAAEERADKTMHGGNRLIDASRRAQGRIADGAESARRLAGGRYFGPAGFVLQLCTKLYTVAREEAAAASTLCRPTYSSILVRASALLAHRSAVPVG